HAAQALPRAEIGHRCTTANRRIPRDEDMTDRTAAFVDETRDAAEAGERRSLVDPIELGAEALGIDDHEVGGLAYGERADVEPQPRADLPGESVDGALDLHEGLAAELGV